MAELLARMDPVDLISLAQVKTFQSIFHYNWLLSQTVTSRLLVADTPAEAVENIILHTDKVLVLNKENVFDNLDLTVLLLLRIHRY